MPLQTTSDLATMVERPQDVTDRANPQAWGVCVHTTGGGLPTKAKKLGVDPMELAISIYCAKDANFAHYVIDGTGAIVQIADEKERGRHAGIDAAERELYLSGAWKTKVSAVGLALWQARWPGVKSPLHLFPSKSPNEDYIGVELIPSLVDTGNGTRFTDEQYAALQQLLDDVAKRHSIKLAGKHLVGHEDLEPLSRWGIAGGDPKGAGGYGWDPGALRPEGKRYFDWALLAE